MIESTTDRAAQIRSAVDATTTWYHVLDLGHGITTPGWFDLRGLLDKLPIPEVRGLRCLDIGTYDGFFAFEMERRGAAEVIATDILDHESWDWPPRLRARGPKTLAQMAGPEKGVGFRVAKDAYASKVERKVVSIYDLSPETVGTFDVVLCGSLLLHLRDPLRALAAVRSVCTGHFLSMETVDLRLTFTERKRPVTRIIGTDDACIWSIPNVAGHKRMLEASGFEVLRSVGPYSIPYGPMHPPPPRRIRTQASLAFQRLMAGPPGVPHAAALTRPI